MARFQAKPEDLSEVIRDARAAYLKDQAPYPVVALLLGLALVPWSIALAAFAFGMSAAWAISMYWSWRALPAEYLWRYAWLQEPMVVAVEEEGIKLGNARGESFIRWDGGIVVRALSSCYVLEDEGGQTALLPKKYLDAEERLLLDHHVTKSQAGQQRSSADA